MELGKPVGWGEFRADMLMVRMNGRSPYRTSCEALPRLRARLFSLYSTLQDRIESEGYARF